MFDEIGGLLGGDMGGGGGGFGNFLGSMLGIGGMGGGMGGIGDLSGGGAHGGMMSGIQGPSFGLQDMLPQQRSEASQSLAPPAPAPSRPMSEAQQLQSLINSFPRGQGAYAVPGYTPRQPAADPMPTPQAPQQPAGIVTGPLGPDPAITRWRDNEAPRQQAAPMTMPQPVTQRAAPPPSPMAVPNAQNPAQGQPQPPIGADWQLRSSLPATGGERPEPSPMGAPLPQERPMAPTMLPEQPETVRPPSASTQYQPMTAPTPQERPTPAPMTAPTPQERPRPSAPFPEQPETVGAPSAAMSYAPATAPGRSGGYDPMRPTAPLPPGATPVPEPRPRIEPEYRATVARDLSRSSTFRGRPMGEVRGLVIHHTGVPDASLHRATAQSTVNGMNSRGLGVQYVMERDGSIVRTLPAGMSGAHTRPAQNESGLSNSNTVGIEVIASNDRTVTPAQRAALQQFVDQQRREHPGIRGNVYGHGELNSHKMTSEGMSAVNDFRTRTGLRPDYDPLARTAGERQTGADTRPAFPSDTPIAARTPFGYTRYMHGLDPQTPEERRINALARRW